MKHKSIKFLLFISIAAFLYSACDSTKTPTNDNVIIDFDGDGYPVDEDCNDNNIYIHPDAPEVASDGYDNNCNDEIDEDIIIQFNDINLKNLILDNLKSGKDQVTNYEILYLDSLYARNKSITDLKGLEYATRLKSLDIANNNVTDILPLVKNPGIKGEDVFIDLVNNLLDKDDCQNINKLKTRKIKIYYDVLCNNAPDLDRDGFNANVDCNDSDPLVHPGASEIGYDGIDNNCNNIIDEYENIKFKDINLKNTVINSLNLYTDEVNNYDILWLDSLIANKQTIADLTGLEYAANLYHLDISENNVTDISPIINIIGFENKDSYINLKNNFLDKEDCANIKKLIDKNIHVSHDVACGIIVDMDNDGVFSNLDCDDEDPFIYPDAPEVVGDKKDNNCNKKTDEPEVVIFNDSNLKREIITSLNSDKNVNSKIYNYELEELESIETASIGIKNLKGLEYAYNLRVIHIENGKMTSIEELAGLKQLKNIYIKSPSLKNISPIKGLSNLTNLSLLDCKINDLSPLSGLNNLEEIHLENNGINDNSRLFDRLKKIYTLWSVSIKLNDISDISSLKNIHWITDLNLYFNNIRDISALKYMTNLTHLNLKLNPINDITPIRDLINLTYLNLESIRASNLYPILGLTNLKSLSIDPWSLNEKFDITTISSLKNLTYLSIKSNGISDISSLSNLESLTSLNLYNNLINDISPLRNLVHLRYLNLNNNSITNIEPLINNPGIYGPNDRVYLHNNQLKSNDCTNIKALTARGVNIYHDVNCE